MTSFVRTGSTFENFFEACSMQNLVLYSLGANKALILLIVAEKSNFESFNDVIRVYR